MSKNNTSSKVTVETFHNLIKQELPFMSSLEMTVSRLEPDEVIVTIRCDANTLRPGGTVAGPVMMGLADLAFYALVLANLGLVALAVTTSLNINFLRKPLPGDLHCRARMLKLGRRLAVCEATLFSGDLNGADDAWIDVAHVTGTYSIPPDAVDASQRTN